MLVVFLGRTPASLFSLSKENHLFNLREKKKDCLLFCARENNTYILVETSMEISSGVLPMNSDGKD